MTALRGTSTVLWLTALWVLLWGNASVANVAGGFAIALSVLILARQAPTNRANPDESPRLRVLALVHLGAFVLYELVKANLLLAWEIVTPTNKIHTGVIAVPLRTDSDLAMMVVASVITLTPGTVTIEARNRPSVLYVHVLHLHDIEEVRRDLLRIEELSVRAFGSRQARAQFASSATP